MEFHCNALPPLGSCRWLELQFNLQTFAKCLIRIQAELERRWDLLIADDEDTRLFASAKFYAYITLYTCTSTAKKVC